MERRLKTNLVLAAALIALGALIVYGPAPDDEPAGIPVLNDANVARIAVHDGGDLRFALERDGESWRLVAPAALPADAFQVDALLAALRQPASRRYPLADVNPAELGLDAPRWRVLVDEEALLVGDRTALGKQRYLQKGEHVYLVPGLLSYRLQRDPLDYASKRLLPEGARIHAVRLPSGQSVERSGNGWALQPENSAVSADDLQRVVDAWRGATAIRVDAADPVPSDGLAVIEFANGEKLRFGVEHGDSVLRLSRDAPAMTYTLPAASAKALLSLAPADPVAED